MPISNQRYFVSDHGRRRAGGGTYSARTKIKRDDRIANGSPVTPAFIFAALLWAPFEHLKKALIEKDDYSRNDAAAVAADQVFYQQQAVISIPKRFSIPAREIWLLQDRLEARRGKKPFAITCQ